MDSKKIRSYLSMVEAMGDDELIDVEDFGTTAGLKKGWLFSRNRAKHFKIKIDKFGSTNEYLLLTRKDLNSERGKRVFADVLRRGEGAYVDKAMYRRETGWIRFDFGWCGNPHPDEDGRTYVGGHGVSHIMAKHGDVEAKRIFDVIANGVAYRKPGTRKIYFVYGSSFAEVTPLHHGGKRILTGFEPKSKEYLDRIKKYPRANCPGESLLGG